MEQMEQIEQIEPKSAKDLNLIAKTIFEAKVKKIYDYYYSKIIKAAKNGKFTATCQYEYRPDDENDSDEDNSEPTLAEYEAAERIEKFFVGIESEACYSFGFIIFKWETGGVEIEI